MLLQINITKKIAHQLLVSEFELETYKIVSGKYDSMAAPMILGSHLYFTRGHDLRLHKSRAKYDLRNYFFSNRVVNVSNSLPGHVVNADTVNYFKSQFDKFWTNQEHV